MTDTTFKFRMPPESWSMCLADDGKADWFMSAYETPITRADVEFSRGDVRPTAEYQASGDPFWDNEETRWARPFNVVRAADGTGVLVISVHGSLVANMPYQLGTWLTGYEYITAAVNRGVADATIKAIVLDINSPGGMVRGCSECGDAIAAAAKAKRVLAFASDTAASAAYWLASQSSEIHVSNTGEVGSIGVITGHFDHSENLRAWGVKFTAIHAGKRKTDGHPYLPLTDEARAQMQKRINAVYAEFISAVARGRGMDGNDIRNTEAAVFASKESVRVGLADRVSTRAEVMSAAFGAQLEIQAEDEDNTQGSDMTEKTEDTTATTPANAVDASAAVAAAMARAQEILDCDEAKGRETQARLFAFDASLAGLSTDKVKAMLAAAPVAAPKAEDAPNAFEAAMNGTANPEVGAGAAGDEDQDPMMAAILANFK